MHPLIGITAYRRSWPETGWPYDVCYAQNARAVEQAGGLPVLIPCHLQPETLRALYQRLDAVLLPGGGDIDPMHYEAQAHPLTTHIDDARDATELSIARWALDDDLPILGICRGNQVLNVAAGGTLIQDIPSSLTTDLIHSIPYSTPRSHRSHSVEIDASSRLASILGTTRVDVNSLHHQSVEKTGQSVKVTAHAPDGVVEAIEIPDKRFVVGVQWHPEDMNDDDAMQRLFNAFVQAARDTMRSSR